MPENIGKYKIVDRIGSGGMGIIYKAYDRILDRFVALKVISAGGDVTAELRARFFREAQACARLSHPNIVTIYDMGEEAEQLFIVMELLEGEELRQITTRRRSVALEDKLSIMQQVCAGLHYAHQRGIVHRDIKPSNVIVQANGQIKILDFGIAQIATTERGLTRTGLIMGTLRYISPEQVRGRADYRSDIFSVGAVFYEVLALRPPFLGEDAMQLLEQLRTEDPTPLTEVDPDIPPELAAIVARAMRKIRATGSPTSPRWSRKSSRCSGSSARRRAGFGCSSKDNVNRSSSSGRPWPNGSGPPRATPPCQLSTAGDGCRRCEALRATSRA